MISIKIAEIAVVFVLLLMLVTQVVVPLYKGRKLFPLFRKKEKELEDQLVDAAEERASVDLADKIEDIRDDTKLTSFQRKKNRDFKREKWSK